MPTSPPPFPWPDQPDQTVSLSFPKIENIDLLSLSLSLSLLLFAISMTNVHTIPTLQKVDSVEPAPPQTPTAKTFYNAWVPPGILFFHSSFAL